MLGVHSLLPVSVLTDSYKISHHLQYPSATKMVAVCHIPSRVSYGLHCDLAHCCLWTEHKVTGLLVQYGEFRAPYEKDQADTRILYYGMRWACSQAVTTLEQASTGDMQCC